MVFYCNSYSCSRCTHLELSHCFQNAATGASTRKKKKKKGNASQFCCIDFPPLDPGHNKKKKKLKSNQINKSSPPPLQTKPLAAELCYILRSSLCRITGRTGCQCSEEARLVGSPGLWESRMSAASTIRLLCSGSAQGVNALSLCLEVGLKLFFLIKDRPLCHGLSWRVSTRWRPDVLRPNLI